MPKVDFKDVHQFSMLKGRVKFAAPLGEKPGGHIPCNAFPLAYLTGMAFDSRKSSLLRTGHSGCNIAVQPRYGDLAFSRRPPYIGASDSSNFVGTPTDSLHHGYPLRRCGVRRSNIALLSQSPCFTKKRPLECCATMPTA
jgi:hypothetical protein